MKKLFFTLGVVLFATNCTFAEITPADTSSLNNIRTQGYSESMVRVIDALKAHNPNPNNTYERVYVQPKRTKFQNAYHNVKLYFDPAQDDGLTLEREINFTNNWMGDDTKYSSPLVKKETIENL